MQSPRERRELTGQNLRTGQVGANFVAEPESPEHREQRHVRAPFATEISCADIARFRGGGTKPFGDLYLHAQRRLQTQFEFEQVEGIRQRLQ